MFHTGETGMKTRLLRCLWLASAVAGATLPDSRANAADEIAKLGEPRQHETTGQGATAERASRVCPPHKFSNIPRPQGRDATPAEMAAHLAMFRRSPTGQKMVDQFSISMEQAIAKRQNMTRHSYDPQHGNQVEFTTAGGQAYLWYPGNAVVLKGEWRACEDRLSMTVTNTGTVMMPYGKVCFKYGPNTYNPATGAKGDTWECGPASRGDARLVEQQPGDSFGLAKKVAVPFTLPRDKTTIDQLLARMSGDRPR